MRSPPTMIPTPRCPGVGDRRRRWLATHSVAEIEQAIGRFDDESDLVVSALLAMPLDDPLVAPVLLAGLRPLIFLCRGRDRRLLNDLVTEAAVAIAELRRVRPVRARRRLAYVIVDRARDRQRASLRRQMACRSIDPLLVAESVAACDPPVDTAVRRPSPGSGAPRSGRCVGRCRVGSILELVDRAG